MECIAASADGSIVALICTQTFIIVCDVGAQLEELVVVFIASIHVGCQQVELRRIHNDVWVFLTVAAACPRNDIPLRIKVDNSAVLGGEADNLLAVAVAIAVSARLGVPSCKVEALAAESVGGEVLRHTIFEHLVAHRARSWDADAAVSMEMECISAPSDWESGADSAVVAACACSGDSAVASRCVVSPRQSVVSGLSELHTVGVIHDTFIKIHRRVRLDGSGVHHILVCQPSKRGVGGGKGVSGCTGDACKGLVETAATEVIIVACQVVEQTVIDACNRQSSTS